MTTQSNISFVFNMNMNQLQRYIDNEDT